MKFNKCVGFFSFISRVPQASEGSFVTWIWTSVRQTRASTGGRVWMVLTFISASVQMVGGGAWTLLTMYIVLLSSHSTA